MRFDHHTRSRFFATVIALTLPALPSAQAQTQMIGSCSTLPAVTCAPGAQSLTPTSTDCFGGCVTPTAVPGWTSEGPAPTAPRLRLAKHMTPAGFHDDVVQVDIEVVARRTATLRVENQSLVNGCVPVLSLDLDISAQFVPPSNYGPFLLTFSSSSLPILGAFDGTLDFGGTSGTTITIGSPTPIVERKCIRVTGYAGNFVDETPGFPADDFLELAHSAFVSVSMSGCTGAAFDSAVFASIEASVTYTVCRTPVGAVAFCFGDGLLADHTSACPCGNNGAPGNGCAHSFDAGGANLSIFGTPANDDVVLHAQFEPANSFNVFLLHTNPGDSVFGDGVLCAGNPLIRLRGRAAVGGEVFFPNSLFAVDSTTTLSIRSGIFPGSGVRRYYTAWFRNASSSFCPPATANTSNGFRIDW